LPERGSTGLSAFPSAFTLRLPDPQVSIGPPNAPPGFDPLEEAEDLERFADLLGVREERRQVPIGHDRHLATEAVEPQLRQSPAYLGLPNPGRRSDGRHLVHCVNLIGDEAHFAPPFFSARAASALLRSRSASTHRSSPPGRSRS
jgi:hypothetical protein